MPRKQTTFESSFALLSTLIKKIESPETPLDSALKLYKEGITIAKACGETLSRYEADVLTLQKEADGVFLLPPFGENHD